MIPRVDLSTMVSEPLGPVLLLLVDNSQHLGSIWHDLRDHCLPSLFRHIQGIHPVQMKTLLVESNQVSDSGTVAPRQFRNPHDAVGDIRFNLKSNNRFSLDTIQKGLELLASTNAAGRHAIILAASPPESGLNDPSSNLDPSRWSFLAQYLAKEQIQCHLMINPNADMSLFTTLFNENLRLQNLIEKQIWFPVDRSKITLRVSGNPDLTDQGLHNNTSRRAPVLSSFDASLAAPHPTLNEPVISSAPESQESVPSLVSQLQQVHGLTKKKVYGAKPVRKPFVSTEVYREGSRKSVSLPPPSPPDTSHGGRVPSSALAGRSTRQYQAAPIALPQSRSPVDSAGPSASIRSSVSVPSYPLPLSSPASPVSPADSHISSLNQWPQTDRHPSMWNSHPTALRDDLTQSVFHPISDDKTRHPATTTNINGFTAASSILPSLSPIQQSYPGPESPGYRFGNGHSIPSPPSSTSTSTSTSPSPNHLNQLSAALPHPSVPENASIAHSTASVNRPSHVPRSVYRDELLSHLDVPTKPLLTVVPGFGSGLGTGSLASSMRSPPSALSNASGEGSVSQAGPNYPLPTSPSSIASHTAISSQVPVTSQPHGNSQFFATPPSNFAPTFSSSPPSHWQTSASTSDAGRSSNSVSNTLATTSNHMNNLDVGRVSSNTFVTSLTIPETYSSPPEISSGLSSGTSSLTGWAG